MASIEPYFFRWDEKPDERRITVANLTSVHGKQVQIDFFPVGLEDFSDGEVDAFISSSEDGFSPLGLNRDFLKEDLGISSSEWSQIAHHEVFESKVAIIGVPSQRDNSQLRGLVLTTPGNRSLEDYSGHNGRGWESHDVTYHLTYQAISYAVRELHAKKIAISHLTGSGGFNHRTAADHLAALADVCDDEAACALSYFAFTGCCIHFEHLTKAALPSRSHHSRFFSPANHSLSRGTFYDVVTIGLNPPNTDRFFH